MRKSGILESGTVEMWILKIARVSFNYAPVTETLQEKLSKTFQ